MGIQLGSNFTVNTALPLDDRTTAVDITARDAILAGRRYEGLIVYVKSLETNYQLVGGITNADWTELSGSGGATSGSSGQVALANNAATTMTGIGDYLVNTACIIVDYYVYRRTDTGFKSMSGRIFIEGQNDAATNPTKWSFWEATRSERGGDSGITFSLTDTDTEKSVLVATLDDYTGGNHSCTFYYNLTTLAEGTNEVALLDNAATTITSIGEYLIDARCIIVDYYIYRRTDSGFKSQSGKLFIEGQNDAATNALKWSLFEAERSERGGDSGVVFSLTDTDVEKSVLVATLDNYVGANYACSMYYNLTKLLT